MYGIHTVGPRCKKGDTYDHTVSDTFPVSSRVIFGERRRTMMRDDNERSSRFRTILLSFQLISEGKRTHCTGKHDECTIEKGCRNGYPLGEWRL